MNHSHFGRGHLLSPLETIHAYQVPYTLESGKKTLAKKQMMQNVLGDSVGNAVYTFQRMVSHLVFGPNPSLLAHLG